MEKQATRKIITMCFLAAALITYVVVNVLFKTFAGSFGVVQRLYSNTAISNGLPVLAAVALFAILQFSPKIMEWAEDVVVEVSKVVWPSRKDTISMTMVVCVFVAISSVVLIVIDQGARMLVTFIIH